MSTAKISLTLSESLLTEARSLVGRRGLSKYVNRALEHELQRDRLTRLLRKLEQEAGPIDQSVMDEVRRTWPSGNETPDRAE